MSIDDPGDGPFSVGDIVRLDKTSGGWGPLGLGHLKNLRARVIETGPQTDQRGPPYFNEQSAFVLFDGETEPRWIWWNDLSSVDAVELLATLHA